MIPFLAPLALKLSPVGAFLKRIPRPVWIAIAVVAVLLLGTCAHKKAVKNHYEEAYNKGVADEGQRIAAKALKIAAEATLISVKLKELNNEENRRIAGAADTLRVSGPGKASCRDPAAPRASRRQPAIGSADASRPEMPTGNGPALPELAAVPWPWLVNRAEQCDLNRAEAETWRAWHKQLTENWEKQQ